jgi:hypothetical protein
MSILNAIKETKHSQDNILDLAKLPQALIMQMAQRGDIPKEMVIPILGKKAEMAESTARMNAAKQLATQGGAQPTVMEKYMGEIAQSEHPAPAMPQQQMQQPMPQQMTQAPTAPEDVGIATQATQPMSMAGGGIVAFDDGGEVDPEDDYQDLMDQAEEDATNEEIYDLINQMAERGGHRGHAAVGIKSGENKHIKEDTRGRAAEHTGDLESRLRAQILQKESGGKRYDKNGNLLTSSKGALGEMQVMPGTARDPGFGIKPAQSNHPDELRRVGDEYSSMLLNRYKDPKLAMIAYNMGPGATDKWLAAGADPSKLPKETQGYIRNVNLAQGGEVKHYVLGDLVMDDYGYPRGADPRSTPSYDDYNRTPTELEEETRKNKKAGMPKDRASKAAEKALEEQKLRRAAMSQPKTANLALGKRALGAVGVPSAVGIGGAYLSNAAANTLAGNKEMANAYFGDEYSDPGSDNAIAYHILNPNLNSKPTTKKDNFVDPNIERLKKMTNYGDAPVRTPAPAQETVPTQEAAPKEEEFNLLKYAREQQAERRKAAEMDKWQAGLAAGLGMLGGTSQYALENIGKGGQMGVQQLANAQRLRASQDIADNKLLGTAYNANMVNNYRNAALAQGKELGEARLNQDMIKAREAHIDKVMKDRHGMDMAALGQLRRQRDLGKLDADKLKDLERLERTIKQVEIDALKKYPMQTSRGSSGVIRLD